MEQEKTLVVAPIVTPAVSPEEAVAAWKKYEALKVSIISDEDIQVIEGKKFLKKSYWRKIATFFNLSCECVKEDRIKDAAGLTYLVTYKATATNGRHTYGDGSCSSKEKRLVKTEHNTRAIAHTRACNRAVSNLVGGGEVSAEEVAQEVHGEIIADPQPENVKEQPHQEVASVFVGDTLPFGKYKGLTLSEIHKKNTAYLDWVLEQSWFNESKWNELREKIVQFLDEVA